MSESCNHNRAVYTAMEIKNILGIGKNEAYRLIHSGEFKVLKLGRKILVPKESFHNWLNK